MLAPVSPRAGKESLTREPLGNNSFCDLIGASCPKTSPATSKPYTLQPTPQTLTPKRETRYPNPVPQLPDDVADSLCAGQRVRPRIHPTVSVFFADIVGFTAICSRCRPREICDMLDELYTVMDCVASAFGIYKIETIGDSYMAAGGLFADSDERRRAEACRTVDMAAAMIAAARHVGVPGASCSSSEAKSGAGGERGGGEGEHEDGLQLRVGIHTGVVASGVVGLHLPRFKLFGENVCRAARLESSGAPGRVHCSRETAEMLRERGYTVESRGRMALKGIGDVETFWVVALPEGVQALVDAAVDKSRTQLQLLRDCKDIEAVLGHEGQRERSWRGAHEFVTMSPGASVGSPVSVSGEDQLLQEDMSLDDIDVDGRRKTLWAHKSGSFKSFSSSFSWSNEHDCGRLAIWFNI